MALTKSAATFIDRAVTALNEGFTSKAGQQRCLADLNTAFKYHRDAAHNAMIDHANADAELCQYGQARSDFFTANDVPFDLHQVRDRHLPIFERFGVAPAQLRSLIDLRAVAKAAPVNAPVRSEPSPYEVKARETLMELIERRQTQYLEAVALGEVFGGLPVSANTHLVTNEHGTTFLRTFFYLRGKLTPLNIIICAAEELKRRAEV